jgi:diguanylate cyclase (GGDEF)-like protein/putative nucleotidyltransferase with HDIG domain
MPFLQIFFWAMPIIALASYILLMLFFSISKKDKLIRIFMLVLASLIVWTASSLFMKMQVYPGPLFWDRSMVVGMVIVPFLLYYFISVFTNSLNVFHLTAWGSMTVAAIIVNLLGYVVTSASVITEMVTVNGYQYKSVELVYSLGVAVIPIYVFMFVLICDILFKVNASIRSGNVTYGRIGLVLVGVWIMFIGVLFNLVPAIGKYPVDVMACFINAILITFAIYKYRMLELRLMVTKGIVYSLSALLLTCVYVYTVFYIERQVGEIYRDIAPYFITISALLVAVVYQPLYRLTCKIVDKMFYKAEYSQRQALKNFSINISNKLDLHDMAEELIEAVQQGIRTREILLMIKSEEKEHYCVFSTSSQIFKPDFIIAFDNPIVKWLINSSVSLSMNELFSHPFFKAMWEKEKRVFSDLGIEVIIPIKSRNDLIGMLMLTGKDNRTAYTLDDLDLLTYLGSSSAVAFDNARLFNSARAEALTDSLTKLHNHRYFHKALTEQVAKIGSSEMSLLMLDLDLFKLYNDLYGHLEGDQALQSVAAIIKRLVGQKGIACRYGGEEFTILLPFYDSKRAYDLAEVIRLEIEANFFKNADVTQRFLTASIGVCTYPHAAANAEELLQRADLAVYTAKSNGKNQTVIYTPKSAASGNARGDNIEPITLKPAYAATIYALTAAIDTKDHYTFGHSQRVAEYAAILADSLGLDKAHLEILREAALLHDVGKIGIPENILTKTGRLTSEEYCIIKKHVEMSITIIKHLPSMNHVVPAVIGHHERWDGRGYPRGLKGENIPLLARCLAITDAFDAMTSSRPYRAALSVSLAISEIKNNMGTSYDPTIANLFIKLIHNGTINIEKNKDKDIVNW